MDNLPPTEVLCRLLGLLPAEISLPHRLLKLSPHERDPHVIDRAASDGFRRIRTVQSGVSTEVFSWMMQVVAWARSAMLAAAGHRPDWSPAADSRPLHATPSAADPGMQDLAMPQLPTSTTFRRRSTGDSERVLGAAAVILGLVVALFAGGWFVDTWFRETLPGQNPPGGGSYVAPRGRDSRPKVRNGSGAAKVVRRRSATDRKASGGVAVTPRSTDTASAKRLCDEAIESARKGHFDEADNRAAAALEAAADYEPAETIRLLVAYQRQYLDLADEALRALNENNVVDLGPKYGDGAFLEMDDDSVTFQISGRPRRIGIEQLNGIPGVRFRITRDYLDNGENTVNDLILGAYHYVSGLTDKGELSVDKAFEQARGRWRRATTQGDDETREQAAMFLLLPRP